MSEETPKQYRSRLSTQDTGPVRGIGAGYAQNQAMVGSEDPQRAAQLASMSQEEFQRLSEEQERLDGQLEEARTDIRAAVAEGVWELPSGFDLNQEAPGIVMKMHADLLEHRKSIIDQQVEEEVSGSISSSFVDRMGLGPDDPLYDPITDTGRRKAIEKDLKPLDFEEMVFQGHVQQEIKLRSNFSITLRTITTQHGLWLEMMLTDLDQFAAQYGRHWFSLLQVACSLQEVNGKPIGSDLGKFDDPNSREDFEKVLRERMKFLGRLPGMLTDDLIVQYTWFSGRVRKLLAGDLVGKVGNS